MTAATPPPATSPPPVPVALILAVALRRIRDDLLVALTLVLIPTGVHTVVSFAEVAVMLAAPDANPVLVTCATLVVTTAAFIPAATAWHRRIILPPGDPGASGRYRIGRAEFLYAKAAAFVLVTTLALLVGLLMALRGLSDSAGFDAAWMDASVVRWPIFFLAYGAVAMVVGAHWLTLPAAAIGQRLRLAEANAIGRARGIRVGAAMALAFYGQVVFVAATYRLGELLPVDRYAAVLVIVPAMFFPWVFVWNALLLFQIGVLSVAYVAALRGGSTAGTGPTLGARGTSP